MSLDTYQQFIHMSRYARFRDDLGRRENWDETVDRYITFFEDHLSSNHGYKLDQAEVNDLRTGIFELEVMPSMRCLMTAGDALRRDHLAAFNCSYLPVSDKQSFSEILYIAMCGTGVGYSVERQFINSLPSVPAVLRDVDTTLVVQDSKEGWASSFQALIDLLYRGQIPKIDVSLVRLAGARLKTFGGRASGPQPLLELFAFTVQMFRSCAGRKLNSLECHDLACMIGEIVVVGGVRRSAFISLSNLSDDRMRHAKSGNWYETNLYRKMANNSVAYTERPEVGAWMREWNALYESKSGERGIFNREAANRRVEALGTRIAGYDWGVNPCGEIILRPKGLCNLSEIVVRPHDDYASLERKARLATILGTMQSTLTNYRYVSSDWQRNAEDERLLGVSMTGILSNPLFHQTDIGTRTALRQLRESVHDVNKEWARKLGIEPSAASTTVKPSGTVSQLVHSPSGIHADHSEYYIRTVRADNKDPLCQFLIESGVPHEPSIGNENSVTVFSFPRKGQGVTRNEMTAIRQLEIVDMFATEWTDHNVSSTITVREHEWPEVGGWVWNNFDTIGGVSFLPFSDHVYKQAPYQECSKDEFHKALDKTPVSLDWRVLADMEGGQDNVTSTKDLACVAGVCEIVDIKAA